MIRSWFSDLKFHALSRLRCCSHILLPNLGLDDEEEDKVSAVMLFRYRTYVDDRVTGIYKLVDIRCPH
ncbi:MAG TPA: hypothetical protein VJP58_03790 [Candidatus Nitrosocosmicus sp.]|nr:hypothetical protein [Candidatus Nitrosocosmicus sp.]